MGVAGSAAAGRLDVRAGRMKVPASHRGVIALNGAGTQAPEPFLR
jgi:hypothetical protein